jgi:hypothetical protein
MTNEQILEQQVEALEKLLQLKQAIIDEQEVKINKLQYPPQPTYVPGVQIGGGWGGIGGTLGGQGSIVSIPSQWTITSWQCSDGHPHQYPTLSSGATPCCTKCGTAYGSLASVTTTITGLAGLQGGAGSGILVGQGSSTTSLSLDGMSQTVTTASNNSAPTNVFLLAPAVNK